MQNVGLDISAIASYTFHKVKLASSHYITSFVIITLFFEDEFL